MGSMRTIWKFQFEISDEIIIEMPEGSEILSIQVQGGMPTLWAICDPSRKNYNRVLSCYGTGHKVRYTQNYIGTIQINGFVWHLFGG